MAIYFVASTLDGFIADPDDDVSWLDQLPQPTTDTYREFIAGIGAIAMGRSSYEWLLRYMEKGHDWMYEQPVWVFTHKEFPPQNGVTFVSGNIAEHYPAMQAAAWGKQIWAFGGGELAAQFYDAGLLDEIRVTIASKTLGAGKPLFPRDAAFELLRSRPLGSGFVELAYRPKRANA